MKDPKLEIVSATQLQEQMDKLAASIEALPNVAELQAENARLREALRPFADAWAGEGRGLVHRLFSPWEIRAAYDALKGAIDGKKEQ